MARPNVHPVAERLWEQLYPVQPNDAELDWPLLRFCHAVTLPLQIHADIALDRPGEGPNGTTMPGWAVLMSARLCPAPFLPYLAQFKGVRVLDGMTEQEMRRRIVATDGFDRGKVDAIRGAARQFLAPSTPGQPATVLVRERFHPDFPDQDMPDDFTVITRKSETPDLVPTRYGGEPVNLIKDGTLATDNVANWGRIGATPPAAVPVFDSSWSPTNTRSVRMTATGLGTSGMSSPYLAAHKNAVPVRPGQSYIYGGTIRGYAASPSVAGGTGFVYCDLTWRTADGTQIGVTGSARASVNGSTRLRVDFPQPGAVVPFVMDTLPAPANAAFLWARWFNDVGSAALQVPLDIAVGGIWAARADRSPEKFVDGSTQGYAWQGAAQDSPTLAPDRWTSPKIERALLEQKPIGDRLHFYVVDRQDYQTAIDSGRTYDRSGVMYPTYNDRTNQYEQE